MQSVLESAVNIAEKVTGKDIDGDGDVGMRAAKVARRGESYLPSIPDRFATPFYYSKSSASTTSFPSSA